LFQRVKQIGNGTGLMVPMSELISVIVISITLIGGVTIVLAGIYQQIRTREMAHRERLAMIEKGLVPPPESDPEAFEQAMKRPSRGSSRATAAGVVTIAVGAGLALLIGLTAGRPDVGIGIGGAIAILGVAFVINGYVAVSRKADDSETR
jgi:hypothetical protein